MSDLSSTASNVGSHNLNTVVLQGVSVQGNVNITQITGRSAEYKEITARIAELEEMLPVIPETNVEKRQSYTEKLEMADAQEDVVGIQSSLGNLFTEINSFEEAETAFRESLDIRRELAAKNPAAFWGVLADTLTNLGNLLAENQDFAGAEPIFQEAVDIRRNTDWMFAKLASTSPSLPKPCWKAPGINGTTPPEGRCWRTWSSGWLCSRQKTKRWWNFSGVWMS